MSIRVTLSCNGKEGIFDCRQATPVGEVQTAAEARRIAAKSGWTAQVIPRAATIANDVIDLCPACTRRAVA